MVKKGGEKACSAILLDEVSLDDGDTEVSPSTTEHEGGSSGINAEYGDDQPGSVRAKFCWAGNQMFTKLDEELHFGFNRNGSLVVATTEEQEKMLDVLLRRGETNGVQRLRIVKGEELHSLEPELTNDARAALYSPDAGIVIPFEFAIALAENAADNGVEIRIRRKVYAIDRTEKGFKLHVDYTDSVVPTRLKPTLVLLILALSILPFVILPSVNSFYALPLLFLVVGLVYLYSATTGGPSTPVSVHETVCTRFVVNAAGGFSDKIARLVGDDSFVIKPRYGEYLLADKEEGKRVRHTLFPTPGPKGKGVLVQRTLWGNLCYGPTARDYNEPVPSNTEIIKYLVSKCKELIPTLDSSKIFTSFTGARAKSSRGDWIIEEAPSVPGFIHVAGIDSPGLAGSPAIALEVVELLKKAGCNGLNVPNPSFNPNRPPIVRPKKGWTSLKLQKEMKRAWECKDPTQNVVCKCEKVTEAEIVEATRRSLPVDNTQAIRRRTRAGMGDCQGNPDNYDCEQRVKAILERELGTGHSIGMRPWPASSFLPQRCLSKEQKSQLK
eukprot:TRINITY_DN10128_c0_g1_i2.p1 TRINITY_DN10128_c0_g1~~TRINITY_DN10128_c0_g1_i2.p1  ORF type:complete len:553 (-),score=125.38 TRINITY_DN10128_c0_g1_i2:99-1757(-)